MALLLVLSAAVVATGGVARADEASLSYSGLLAQGPEHACGLLEPGEVYCWGRGNVGQLGYGSTSGVGDGIGPDLAEIDKVELGAKVSEIAVGDLHSCALLVQGKVRCWGKGDDGRLGYASSKNVGDSPRRSVAKAPAVDLSAKALSIAAGGDSTCAILTEGAVECWRRSVEPRAMALSAPAVAIAVSADLSCAVLENGSAECWTPVGQPVGKDLDGEAIEVSIGSGYGCVLLESGQPECWSGTDDVLPIDLDAPAVALSVGGERACALAADNSLWCWSESNDVPQAAGVNAVALAVGPSSICTITTSEAQLHCWGDGAWGKLGRGGIDAIAADGSIVIPASGSSAETVTTTFGGDSAAGAPADDASGAWWLLILLPILAGGATVLWRRRRSSAGGPA